MAEMGHKSFDCFGVELRQRGEFISRKYFDTMKEAVEYARDNASAGYGYEYLTADKFGNVIEYI